ncbi:MAG: hypothetical protein GY791_08415 [Alphaproteobacteria bacterium]|nr:hypothetical protein [Alphaproteobacteria bacterium]
MPDFPRGLPVAASHPDATGDAEAQDVTVRRRQLEARAAAFPIAAGLMEEGAAALAAQLDAETVPPADAVMADLDARLAARIDALPQPERAGLDGSRAALRDRVQRQAALRAAAGGGERIDRAVLDGIARQAAAVRAEPALFGLARDELALLLDDLGVSGAHRADIERRAGQRLARAAVTGTIAGEGGAAALDLLENGAFAGVLAPDIEDRLRTMARAAAATGDAERSAGAAEAEAREAGRLAADMRAGRGDRTDILDAFADGRIGAATRDRLWRQAEARTEREIARRTDMAAVAARVAGDGPPLDPAEPADISAADRFYDVTVAPGLAELDLAARGEAVADAVLQLGLVPAGARTFVAVALAADDPALRQAGAAAIAAIAAEAPDLATAFDERDVAFAETFTAARRAGIDETEALQAGERAAERLGDKQTGEDNFPGAQPEIEPGPGSEGNRSDPEFGMGQRPNHELARTTLAVPVDHDPWRGTPFTEDDRNRKLAMLQRIENVQSTDELDAIDQEIEDVFGENRGIVLQLRNAVRAILELQDPEALRSSADGSDPTAELKDARRFLDQSREVLTGRGPASLARQTIVELREKLLNDDPLDDRHAEDAVIFGAYEEANNLRLRPTKGNGIAFIAGDSQEPLFVLDRNVARAVAVGEGKTARAFQLLTRFIAGGIDRAGFDREAESFSVFLAEATPEITASDVVDTDLRDALLAAANTLEGGADAGAVMTAFASERAGSTLVDGESVIDFVLDVLPIVGHVRSLGYAIDDFEDLRAALEEGDFGAATLAGVMLFLDTVGAIPGIGTVFGPGIKSAKVLLGRMLESNVSVSRRFQMRALAGLPGSDPLVEWISQQDWFKRLIPKEQANVQALAINAGARAAELFIAKRFQLSGFFRGRSVIEQVGTRISRGKRSVPDIVEGPRAQIRRHRKSQKNGDIPVDELVGMSVKEVKTGGATLTKAQETLRQYFISVGRPQDFVHLNVPLEEIPLSIFTDVIERYARENGIPLRLARKLSDQLYEELPSWTPVWLFLDAYVRGVSGLERIIESEVESGRRQGDGIINA